MNVAGRVLPSFADVGMPYPVYAAGLTGALLTGWWLRTGGRGSA
ncbi:hypothetical protein ABZW11_31355 [Nonomuraea sp. NPDC004580]